MTTRAEKLKLHFGTRRILIVFWLIEIAVCINKMNVEVINDFVNFCLVLTALQSKPWMYLVQHDLITIGQSNLKLKGLMRFWSTLNLCLKIALWASVKLLKHFLAYTGFFSFEVIPLAFPGVDWCNFFNGWLFTDFVIRVDIVQLVELNHDILINIFLFKISLHCPVLKFQSDRNFEIIIVDLYRRGLFYVWEVSLIKLVRKNRSVMCEN